MKAETVDGRLKKLLCNDGGNLSPFMLPANDSSFQRFGGTGMPKDILRPTPSSFSDRSVSSSPSHQRLNVLTFFTLLTLGLSFLWPAQRAANPASSSKTESMSGLSAASVPTATAGTWRMVGRLAVGRHRHTATLLQDGRVLVAGGYNPEIYGFMAVAEVYDPATGTWSATGSMHIGRAHHTATLLRDGRVLVAGGFGSSQLHSAEIYDPSTGTWALTGNMNVARAEQSATLLNNGKVLVAGTYRNGPHPDTVTAELYDPAAGVWTNTGSMNVGRNDHAAVLLPDRRVLVVGCAGGGGNPVTEIYDLNSGSWTRTGDLNLYRESPAALLLPDGRVLAVGGFSGSNTATAEIYDLSTGNWTLTGSMAAGRRHPNLTLMTNGKVLATGGQGPTTAVEVYDSDSGTWSLTVSLNELRENPTTTLLPDGTVLVAAGAYISALTSAEIYRPNSGSWSPTGSMNSSRYAHTVTLLPDGTVLAAGGGFGSSGVVGTAERYNPATGAWGFAGNLDTATRSHSATLLADGRVLIAGGYDNSNTNYARAELYDPVAGTWTLTGSMNIAREEHGAVLLPNGKVLVAGGADDRFNFLDSAELYDPATGLWTLTGSLSTGRRFVTLTLLKDGKVLAAGGQGLSSAEIYDPQTGVWTATGNMNGARWLHSATLLPNGKVMVAGSNGGVGTVELYDPSSGTWTMTGSMIEGRYGHMAVLLPDGRVFVAGGYSSSQLSSAEVYDPVSGQWTEMPHMGVSRELAAATILFDGRVLVTGGGSAELFNSGLGFSSAWRPVLSTATSPLSLGQAMVTAGSLFDGISEASAGHSQGSATNYPLVQLRSLVNEAEIFLPVDTTIGWSSSSFTSRAIDNFPSGPALATVFTNAIPSVSQYVVVTLPAPTPTPTPTSCVAAPSGLVSWWPGDGNASDIAGANHGTLINGPTFVPGMAGQAFSFDGVDDFVEIPEDGSLDLNGDFTIDAWVKPNELSGSIPRPIVSKYSFAGENWPNTAWELSARNDGKVQFGLLCGTTTLSTVTTNPVVSVGEFAHVAAVYRQSVPSVEIYVDGVLQAANSGGTCTVINQNDIPVRIGMRLDAAVTTFFNGLIDEVEIFDRPLSASEVQSIFNAGGAGKCKNRAPVAVCQDVTVTAGSSGTANASIDNGSFDPDGDSITITQSPEGPYAIGQTTITLTVEDNNHSSSSCQAVVTVFYNFDGFFQPVDNSPIFNLANVGSAIPMKFSLHGNQGLDIFAAGHPASQETACSNAAPVSTVEEIATAGNSGLSYDMTTDQYTYVWKTDKSWKGRCRQLILKLNDSSLHVANFQFR